MLILIPLLFAIVGVLVYALASNPKVVEIGRILFFAGIFVTLLRVDAATVSLLR